jgi:hypothetical protein
VWNRMSAGAGWGNRFYIRGFWTDVAGRYDFIGLQFKTRSLLYQQCREFRVPCGAGKTQQRQRLTRQIPSSNHRAHPQQGIRVLTIARAISFIKSVKVNAASSNE